MNDLISRQAATEHLKKRLYETELNSTAEHPYYEEIADNRVDIWMNEVPSVQPERRPMLYRDRVMLAKNFEEWARENHVIDCPEAVICYLDIIGLIQPERKTGRHPDCPLDALQDESSHSLIFGYPLEYLVAFAEACRRAGVDESDLKTFANNCTFAYATMAEEYRQNINHAIDAFMGNTGGTNDA